MLTFARFIPVRRGRQLHRGWPALPTARRSLAHRYGRWGLAALALLCVLGSVAVVGWTLAGKDVTAQSLFGQTQLVAVSSADGTLMHLDSSPAGAQVHIDGAPVGKTPLETSLTPGQHALKVQHPDALDEDRTFQVGDAGASLVVNLWGKHPDVVAIRPVYPGASLLDARFLNNGQVALVVGIGGQTNVHDFSLAVWLLDPATGQIQKLNVPGLDSGAFSPAVAPNGDQLAYVRTGSSAPVTATGWSVNAAPSGASQMAQPDSVWVAPVVSAGQPRHVFDLPLLGGPSAGVNSEHIVDLIWTADGSRLVVITRHEGPPVRSRVFLLNIPPAGSDDPSAGSQELLSLPAEVLPGSATIDPSGGWLALIARAAAPPTGNDLLSLCVLSLRAGGAFRNLAQLGSGTAAPVVVPVAWPLDTRPELDRVVFVAPAPAAPSASGGLFGIFGALRPAAPPSGLFAAQLEPSVLADVQPRRLGSAINNFGLIWRHQTMLYAFAPEGDGALALHSVDPASGVVTDLGVRLSIGATLSAPGLSARWDAHHGYALVLAHAPGGTSLSAPVQPLQAWLVSFVRSNAPADLAR